VEKDRKTREMSDYPAQSHDGATFDAGGPFWCMSPPKKRGNDKKENKKIK